MGNEKVGKKPYAEETKQRNTAVVYLRVSSIGQVNTDRDGEGFSIAAQRDACLRKAESLDADVLEVYVDAGESARKADRPQLQAMLERLKSQRDADFVIVHKVDRLARNRGDDVDITLTIRQSGARLVSVTENIDETPSGMLLHGIMSSIAEFYSQNLSSEIIKGTSKKVQRGGYPGLAPIGYLNRQDLSGGNEFRWVEIDAERAEHITWAFESYASGDYSLNQLTEALAARGLKTRETPMRPARPLVVRHVHHLLHNRFYLGLFSWGGVEYQGNHEPLISIEVFARVQALLHSRNQAGDRPQKHPHYLKGTIFCARCGSRMIFSRNKGHGGTYDYFTCIGRHQKRSDCDLPYISVDDIEIKIASYYDSIVIDQATVKSIYRHLLKAAKRRNSKVQLMVKRERKRVLDLEAERRKLLKAHLAGAVPLELMQEEQTRIALELANAGALLVNAEVHWDELERNLECALEITTRLGEAYRLATSQVRRYMNQALFEEIGVDVDGTITYARLAEPFRSFNDDEFLKWLEQEMVNPEPTKAQGSNMDLLVEVMGFEPTASTLRT